MCHICQWIRLHAEILNTQSEPLHLSTVLYVFCRRKGPILWAKDQWLTYLLTYLLTHSMVRSPSWEANWFAASQEIPRISRNPNVHYRTHKRPPTFSILGQPNAIHIPTSNLLEIHPNIIHPSTPRSLQWSPSLQFPHQEPIHPLSSHIRATCPAHLILLDFITRRTLGEGNSD